MSYKDARKPTDREADLAIISNQYLEGKLQVEIAEHISGIRTYSITQQTVSNDLKTIRSRWLESSLRDFDTAKAQELAKVDKVEAEAWKAWERTIGTNKTRRTKTKTYQGLKSVDKTVIAKELAGDPRFLAVILDCVEKRAKLLGLNEAEKIDVRSSTVTNEERADRVLELLAAGGISQN